ncbi:MAG: S49 family peptidase [Rhodospirillales bacterium]
MKPKPSLFRRALRLMPIQRFRDPPPVASMVRLTGVITGSGLLRTGLSAEAVEPLLRRAFTLPNAACVALVINSPGGSPAQSELIGRRIRALAREHDVPVIAFCEDAAASGGYWLALAADEIFAMPSSIVGSIGVVSAGFGFEGLIEKIGVERRMHTAGERKRMLDPFRAEREDDVEHLKNIQSEIHEAFKAWVRERRGARLKADEAEAFSGAFWTGAKALEMGLIDGVGDMRGVLRERLGERVRIRHVRAKRSFFQSLRGGNSAAAAAAAAPGAGARAGDWAGGLIAAAEERLTWNRLGL